MKMRNIRKVLLLSIILVITIGFAVISSNLKVNGLFRFSSNEWNVFLENAIVESGSVTTIAPSISSDKLSATFSVTLKEPGDYYQFFIDATNESTLDAMISGVTISGLEDVSDYLDCTVTYHDGSAIEVNDILYKHFSNTFKVTLEYKDIVLSQIPTTDLTPTVTISINYRQANSSAVFKENTNVKNFDYAGSSVKFVVPYDATYKLEVWGSAGGVSAWGGTAGPGGFSTGNIILNENDELYVFVGGREGKNGGAVGTSTAFGGDGTHIALDDGTTSTFENKVDRLLIVAGGGGSAERETGGSGGGYIGGSGSATQYSFAGGGTQTSGGLAADKGFPGTFGAGGSGIPDDGSDAGPGGGGGFYGGGGVNYAGGAGGGSGYIGNTSLTDKIMYCYNCQSSEDEDDETHIKTRSTTNLSELPISNYAKSGNGYARIWMVSVNE